MAHRPFSLFPLYHLNKIKSIFGISLINPNLMKSFTISIVLLLLLNFSFSQEKWSVSRNSTRKPVGNYVPLPMAPVWENTNTETRFYQTPVGDITVGPNVRVLPNTHQQDEIVLV